MGTEIENQLIKEFDIQEVMDSGYAFAQESEPNFEFQQLKDQIVLSLSRISNELSQEHENHIEIQYQELMDILFDLKYEAELVESMSAEFPQKYKDATLPEAHTQLVKELKFRISEYRKFSEDLVQKLDSKFDSIPFIESQ